MFQFFEFLLTLCEIFPLFIQRHFFYLSLCFSFNDSIQFAFGKSICQTLDWLTARMSRGIRIGPFMMGICFSKQEKLSLIRRNKDYRLFVIRLHRIFDVLYLQLHNVYFIWRSTYLMPNCNNQTTKERREWLIAHKRFSCFSRILLLWRRLE